MYLLELVVQLLFALTEDLGFLFFIILQTHHETLIGFFMSLLQHEVLDCWVRFL